MGHKRSKQSRYSQLRKLMLAAVSNWPLHLKEWRVQPSGEIFLNTWRIRQTSWSLEGMNGKIMLFIDPCIKSVFVFAEGLAKHAIQFPSWTVRALLADPSIYLRHVKFCISSPPSDKYPTESINICKYRLTWSISSYHDQMYCTGYYITW